MGLVVGTRLGPYEILAPIGAGGMGEVYRARDTRLARDVAIKIVPESFAQRDDLRARFEREAKTLSSLSHPHICTVFDIGRQETTDYIVLELLEGETLTERLTKGALPLAEALRIGIQIASALDAAHRRGVVHRDLKPGNIMLTKAGAKLLDFGLAKYTPAAAASLTSAPTRSEGITEQGVVLGTFQYMAPEQLEAKEADARTDIFALGVVFYEMLTGKPAFSGASRASLIASILAAEPAPMSSLQPVTPPALDHLVRRALAKDPEERWQSAHDIKAELEWIAEGGSQAGLSPVSAPRQKLNQRLPWIVAGLMAALAVSLWPFWRVAPLQRHPLMRLSVDLGPEVVRGPALEARISPNGRLLVFLARTPDGKQQLATRSLDGPRITFLAGTENATFPFFSQDGQWIAFFADGRLKKIAVQGGAVVTIANPAVPHVGASVFGASWGDDQNIVYTPGSVNPLVRVSANGGKLEPLTKLGDKGDATHRWPQVLAGGRAVLFTSHKIISGFDDATIEAVIVSTGERKTVLRGGYAGRYLAAGDHSGYLLYVREGALFGIPFDPDSLTVRGAPSPLLDEVAGNSDSGEGQFDVSDDGTLIYRAGKGPSRNWPILWMDRSGRTEPLLAEPGAYYTPRFSPDGNRLALTIDHGDKGREIHIYDWRRGSMSQLTFTGDVNLHPVWSPDGKFIVFESSSPHGYGIGLIRADGSGPLQRLAENNGLMIPTSFTPDGRRLAYFQLNAPGRFEIWTAPFNASDPDHPELVKPKIFLSTSFYEWNPIFSPDGRWIAYTSSESGRNEIYVRPFPGPGGKWQISAAGANEAVWSLSGYELYFKAADGRIMVSDYKATNDSFLAGKPQVWSDSPIGSTLFGGNFNQSQDGRRFAVLPRRDAPVDNGSVHVTFVLNFLDELKARVPTK